MVPDPGEEIFTDCVVPIGKLNLSDAFSSDDDSFPLSSHFLNSEVSVGPLLSDHYAATDSNICEPSGMSRPLPNRTQNTLPPAYSSFLASRHHPGDVTRTALEWTENESPPSYYRRMETNTAPPHIPVERYTLQGTSPTRHAVSTEQLSRLPDVETQRVRRNSSGSEPRTRRHSAASFRLTSQIQRHRRRSHDVTDERVDLLERLHVAATRRRRSLSLPFQTSPRSHGSQRPNNFRV